MNFKEWLLSEEIFPNKTATVYHRTCSRCDKEQSVKSVSSILTSDFKSGAGVGCYYGCGLYTTFAIESQFTNYMKTYGEAVIKFKVTDLDKYLIFQLSVAKQIHGKDYKISDQLKKLGLLNKLDQSNLKEYDERQEKENYSSKFAREFYDKNDWIVNSVKGIIYYGRGDGYCLLKYPTVQDGTINMLGYAVAEHDDMEKMEELKQNDGWIKSVGLLDTPIKSVYKYLQSKNKEKFSIIDKSESESENVKNAFLKSKNLEKTAQKLAPELNKLSDDTVSSLLRYATDKDKMAEAIIKYKTELSDDTVSSLLRYATDKDAMAEYLINKKTKLSDDNVRDLLDYATDKDAMAEYLINKQPELSDNNVRDLIIFAKDKEKFLQIIINKKPKLSDNNVYWFLDKAINKDAMADLIIEKQPYLSNDNVANLLWRSINKDKFAEIIANKKPELSYDDIWNFFFHSTNKEKTAELIQKQTDNISKLSNKNVEILLQDSKDKPKLAQILNKYYKNKTSEIQEILDKYLEPQAIAAK